MSHINQTIPKVLNIDVQQGNGTYNVTWNSKLPCEDCYIEETGNYKLGAYGNKGNEFGKCLKHYEETFWLDKKAIITVREWF